MTKIMIVDDEVLALDYLEKLLDWERHGYSLVGSANGAKKALAIFEEKKPDIAILDIQMPGTNGLELARLLKEKNPELAIILLTAYKDFDYALKGIQYGVSNYLLKHELSKTSLLEELNRIQNEIGAEKKKKQINKNHLMKQLIYGEINENELQGNEWKNKFFIIMLHKNSEYLNGAFVERAWDKNELESVLNVSEKGIDNKIFYVADAGITPSNQLILFSIADISSKFKIASLIEEKLQELSAVLAKTDGFNIVYSQEISLSEISFVFRKISQQIRHSMFWKDKTNYSLYKLLESKENKKFSWNDQMDELRDLIYKENEAPVSYISYLFEQVKFPNHKIRTARELLYSLENLLRKIEEDEGVHPEISRGKLFKIEELEKYYINYVKEIFRLLHDDEFTDYSRLINQVLRYVRNNYHEELSLDILGREFQMNGVYLGQLFKEEVGVTFLKYLTHFRIEKAKKLLEEGNLNISEVAAKVGYRTSQYFSKAFLKNVGIKPQEYRKWGTKKEKH